MGGKAFAKPGANGTKALNIPRMPADVYKQMVEDITQKLEMLFHQTAVPRDAPGKVDYGDIDILVEGPLRAKDYESWELILALGAERYVRNGMTQSFAIPRPDYPDIYVQVDLELVHGDDAVAAVELFEWAKLMKGDSDLLQIIGVAHRSLGLTFNDKGLYLRIEEIEPHNRKESMVFLTRDPKEAIAFLGLNVFKWENGFQTEEELFNWVAKGRFFNRDFLNKRNKTSNDRQRLKKRGMYRRFVKEYMQTHPEAGTQGREQSRKDVVEQALAMFNGRYEYEEKMEKHTAVQKEDELWYLIKQRIPCKNESLRLAVRALKRWVDFFDGQPEIRRSADLGDRPKWTVEMSSIRRHGLEDEFLHVGHILAWVEENWEEVRKLEKARLALEKHSREAGKVREQL
ncbi:hypothetical protein K469DRAFT_715875 [Zopfia rhizophila CBS 207.26]|uniref:Nucleotidyltransferase n=1 Tax=Zopfia rhizophila CBS 207.26 TaxID=1314779 RepID=A0A6A6DNG0_9PEZI|nr:hypothetical protein K469DRAFT_715875 [Zopfia rhizophila CBS 207.26]